MNLLLSQHPKSAVAFLLAWCLLVNVAALSGVTGGATASSDHIGEEVASAATFLHERSGVVLSTELKTRLSTIEQQTQARVSRRISVPELALIVTDIMLQRIASLTNEEIQQAARTFRHEPNSQYDYILLSWDGKHTSTQREFVTTVKSFRQKSRNGDATFRATLRQLVYGKGIGEGVNGRAQLYSKTLPEQYGRVLDDGLTPLQAVLIMYSLASDDIISAPTSSLRAEMELEHQTIGGSRFPDPKGRFPFGAQGYLFPTPIDLIFNERTINDLLDQIERKSRASVS